MTLLAAWNFDEASGAVIDASGNGHGFTPAGTTTRTASGGGHSGTGSDKALTQSSATTDAGPALTGLQTSNRTLMAWIKRTSNSQDGWVLEMFNSGISSGCWGILFLSGSWHIQARNSSNFARASVTAPSTSVWHHFAGTYDGTNIRAYLDGTLVATTALAGPMRTDATVYNVFDTAGSATVIDDVRHYDTVLTQAQIASDMSTPVSSGSSFSGNVALAGAGTLSNAGTPAIPGSVALSGSGSLTNAGTPAVPGALGLSGSGAATDNGSPSIPGSAAFSGTGTLAGSASVAIPGSAALAGNGSLASGGTPALAGATSLAGAGSLTTAGQPALPGSLQLSGSGLLLGSAGANYSGAINLAGSGTLGPAGAPAAPGALSLAGSGGLIVIGQPAFARDLVLAGAGSLTGSSGSAHSGSVQFSGVGQLAKGGSHGPAVQSVLTATHSGPVLTPSQSLPDLSPSNAPSSQLEVSHGV